MAIRTCFQPRPPEQGLVAQVLPPARDVGKDLGIINLANCRTAASGEAAGARILPLVNPVGERQVIQEAIALARVGGER